MFAGCFNIKTINFLNFNLKYVINMKYMFYKCKNLENIDYFLFDKKMLLIQNACLKAVKN